MYVMVVSLSFVCLESSLCIHLCCVVWCSASLASYLLQLLQEKQSFYFSLFVFILSHHMIIICYILLYRGGDCHQAFLPHRECVCYDRCPRCCVEFELDVNFDKFNQTRPDQEKDLPLTVTSRDLVCTIILYCIRLDFILHS